jgi:5-methylcytosine-specific restriction endonuclease McrA
VEKSRAAAAQKGKPMPKRPFQPKHRAIVTAQQELLKWCPNLEGASKNDLEYVCWACGARNETRATRCHIERYEPNEADRPDNFILLCDRCHREQPDALPKEALKYWLATRESKTKHDERIMAVFNAAFTLLPKEFGDFVVRVVRTDMENDVKSWIARCESWIEQYVQTKSAGQGSQNRNANIEWSWFAEIYKWCLANKDRVELEFQEFERAINAARLEASRIE